MYCIVNGVLGPHAVVSRIVATLAFRTQIYKAGIRTLRKDAL